MTKVGYRDETGKIKSWPTEWATGGAFSHGDHPTATEMSLGGGAFCVLPIGVGSLTEGELQAVQDEANAQTVGSAPAAPPSAAQEVPSVSRSVRGPKSGGAVTTPTDDSGAKDGGA